MESVVITMTDTDAKASGLELVGWREWVALPELGVSSLKCKVDTGARTSALHTFHIDEFRREGQRWVKFGLHPQQKNTQVEVWCEAPVSDVRQVTDSGGHMTERYFIVTPLLLGSHRFDVEMSLTSRDNMLFRMLLGRQALKRMFYVNPAASYLQGRPNLS